MRVGILTSGGDSPGMNSLLINFSKITNNTNIKPLYFIDGLKGLYDWNYISDIKKYYNYFNLAGSFLHCSRFENFLNKDVQKQIIKNLKENLDVLIIVGGNGSFEAAKLLRKNGIKVFFIPATIDNDFELSEYCLGFDSTLNEIKTDIVKINYSTHTHKSICMIELMGRYSNDILNKSINFLFNSMKINKQTKVNEIVNKYNENNSLICLFKEYEFSSEELDDLISKIKKEISIPIRKNVLGYIQRGAEPSAVDLNFSHEAISLIIKNIKNDNEWILVKDNSKIKLTK